MFRIIVILCCASVCIQLAEHCVINEACVWESFEANCSSKEVLQIKKARFGRLGSSKCFYVSMGEKPCYADVQQFVERQCSGRGYCRIKLTNEDLRQPPSNCSIYDQRSLEIEYKCIDGAWTTKVSNYSDTTAVRTADPVIVLTPLVVSLVALLSVIAIIIGFICRKRCKKGATEQADETTPDSKPVIYENVAFDENSRTGDSQAATYIQLTSLTQASQPVYASIDMAGKMLDIPNNPFLDSPDYKNI